ncbi:MAG TPA: CHAT domain-containing tetratricopeptide repeat protein [Cytophagaceae bacterium]
MIRYIFILFILLPSLVQAEKISKEDKKKIRIENKLYYIKQKYEEGHYEEAISKAHQVINQTDSEDLSLYKAEALLYQAKASAALFNFTEANKSIDEVKQLASNTKNLNASILIHIGIAEYLAESGNIFEAWQTINIYKNTYANKDIIGNDLLLAEAKILLRQGFIKKAFTELNAQEEYRKSLISPSSDTTNFYYKDKKLDLLKRKETYAYLLKDRIKCLIALGESNDALQSIEKAEVFVKTTLGNRHPLLAQLKTLEAEINVNKNNYLAASTSYVNAYTANNSEEKEIHKLTSLVNSITTLIQSGRVIDYTQYLRRLQMHSYRNVGKTDPFELAYEYCQSYKSYSEGHYSAALSRIKNLSERFKFLPENHEWNERILRLRALISLKSGDIEDHQKTLVQLSELKLKYQGEATINYHKALLEEATINIAFSRNLQEAEKIFLKSYYSIVTKEVSSGSAENLALLTALADLYYKTDKLDSAAAVSRKASEVAEKIFGNKSLEYTYQLALQAQYELHAEKYQESFQNLEQATSILEGIKQGDIEKLLKTYFVLAEINRIKGDFQKSERLLNKAYPLTLQGYEKRELTNAEVSQQAGILYLHTGNYSRAEKTLQKTISVIEELLGDKSPLLSQAYQELARLYLINGNYSKADQLLKAAKSIIETTYGNSSLHLTDPLLITADYYIAIADYKRAEEMCLQTEKIQAGKVGTNHLKRAEILGKLALIRSKLSNYKPSDIEKLYSESTKIIKTALGVENPLYALEIRKQAEFYISINKVEAAEPLLNEAEKYWNKKLGTDNTYSAEIQLLRGNLAYLKDNYNEAEKAYEKARSIYARLFDDKHPQYINATGKLAKVLYMKKETNKSLELMESIIPKYLNYTKTFFPSLSFREKNKFWNNLKEEFEFYNYLALSVYGNKKNKLSASVYNNIIATKALLLSSDIKIRESILSSRDSVLIDLFNEYINLKEYYTTIHSLTKSQQEEQGIDARAIENRIEHLEKELSRKSDAFLGEEKKHKATWEVVKNSLNDNEYAVEIVRYRKFNKHFTDTVIYAALVLSKLSDGQPTLVLLPQGQELEKKYFKYYRNSTIFKTQDKYSYEAYWKPIKEIIPDGATVYLSSDGVYNQINVEMMVDGNGTYAIDQNLIVMVTNTKDLISSSSGKRSSKESKKGDDGKFVLCGNPDFYSDNYQKVESIANLQGAELEIKEIEKILQTNNKPTLKLLNEEVQEETLKSISNPKVFHIATHGYFKETDSSNEDDFTSNPLLNSGLMLANSGDIISNSHYVNHADGILTAYEAMNLSFTNTELVVLSACETGRGEVQTGEGVYGLQRSFLIAGADAVIMSLFKVNDEVTQKLMSTFYTKWLASGNKRTAFIEAKREIKKEYGATIFWGAFVMIEGKPRAQSIMHDLAKK